MLKPSPDPFNLADDAVKRLEDVRQVFFGDADARVLDFDQRQISPPSLQSGVRRTSMRPPLGV